MSGRITYSCDWCRDSGKYYALSGGNKVTLGTWWEEPCPHCRGNWAEKSRFIDRELKDALTWFKSSTPPDKPFRLSKFKTVSNPALYWENLRKEIATDNIYVLERIREDLIAMQTMFGGVEFE